MRGQIQSLVSETRFDSIVCDFLAVAPNAIHMEEALGNEDAVFVVARACSEITVVNVDGPELE